MKILGVFFTLLAASSLLADLKVASLHPLMSGLVREIGGEHVSLVEIGKVGSDLHRFSPTPEDLLAMSQCELLVASGKGFEPYLGDIRDALKDIRLLEIGETIPSLMMEGACAHCAEGHDHVHDHGEAIVDPHWWHDVKNMERAARIIERTLSEMDAAHQSDYAQRSKVIRQRFRVLQKWVKEQIASVPEDQRKLVTAHAAFGYFCEAYDFEPIFVMGVSGDHEVPAQKLADDIAMLKANRIKAVFPEKTMNAKVLNEIAKEAGAKVGTPLIADGAILDYVEMMRANVTAITQALSPETE